MRLQTSYEDTITAISTPLYGESGIGIVRLSGNDSIKIISHIFQPKEQAPITGYKSHSIHFGWIFDIEPDTGEKTIIDEVLVTVMLSPKTYTREDVVEISGHGGINILKKILDLCIKHGSRMAEPGEFTKRAFLNGRIDLIQAESVCDLIRARTDISKNISIWQLKGILSEKINLLRDKLINIITGYEVSIDHSEDELTTTTDTESVIAGLDNILTGINGLLDTVYTGKIFRNGIKISIIGKPNVGKSSLLNVLLSEDRAIVTDIPGTTRDIISETFNLNGIPVTVLDTAGIRMHLSEPIEQIAINRTKSVVEQTEIILYVIDSNINSLDADEHHIIDFIKKMNKKTLLVLNKCDLYGNKQNTHGLFPEFTKYIYISALKQSGIQELRDILYNLIMDNNKNKIAAQDIQDNPVITNMRHETALKTAKNNIISGITAIKKSESPELAVIHLQSALTNFDELLGKTSSEDILNRIFSQFCIGK